MSAIRANSDEHILTESFTARDPLLTSFLVPWDRRREDGDVLSERRAQITARSVVIGFMSLWRKLGLQPPGYSFSAELESGDGRSAPGDRAVQWRADDLSAVP
jgi:hypothetical protein